MNEFQIGWATKNKSKMSYPSGMYVFVGLVWLVAVLNLACAVTEVPNSVNNLAFGLTWFMTFTMAFVGVLGVVVMMWEALDFKKLEENLNQRVEKAKDQYKMMKGPIAYDALKQRNWLHNFKTFVNFMPTLMLFSNGSYICGMSFLFLLFVGMYSVALRKHNSKEFVLSHVTPENVAWVELPKKAEEVVLEDVETVKVLVAE